MSDMELKLRLEIKYRTKVKIEYNSDYIFIGEIKITKERAKELL